MAYTSISEQTAALRAARKLNKQLAKQIKELESLLDEIEAVSCGEKQIKSDGVYNDSDGLLWIYKRMQALKGK